MTALDDFSASTRHLIFCDDFEGHDLDLSKWFPFYLPHWSSRARSKPHYSVENGHLVLRIDPDQAPWCPEFDGQVKVSSIQTGQFSGPLGSSFGQHRFSESLVVREEQRETRLYTPLRGAFELRAKADISANNLVALFLIGFERDPEDSGEITVMEIFGHNASTERTRLGHGIKAINDHRLTTDFHEDLQPFDVADWHIYGAEWSTNGVSFFLDGQLLRHVTQSPAYPMQVMLNIYELPSAEKVRRQKPATLTVDYFRGYGAA
jgi:hypothetical protein